MRIKNLSEKIIYQIVAWELFLFSRRIPDNLKMFATS